MSLSDHNKIDLSFKNLQGKAHTDAAKELQDETNASHEVTHKTRVWVSDIDSNPLTAESSCIAGSLHAVLELVSGSGGQSYIVRYPPGHILAGDRVTDIIPPTFGAAYAVAVFDQNLNPISETGTSPWVFQYESGVLFRQVAAGETKTPTSIGLWVYTGLTLADVGFDGGTGPRGFSGYSGINGVSGYSGYSGVGALAYSATFNATTDWGSPSGGLYTITFAHGLNTPNVVVEVWDEVANVSVIPTINKLNNNTISISVLEMPDSRFTGRIVINGAGASGYSGFSGYSGEKGISGYSGNSALAFSASFNATTSWGVASSGLYSIIFAHNLNSHNLVIEVWDEVENVAVVPTIGKPDSNTITISVFEVPDSRFSGRIVINGSALSGYSGYSGATPQLNPATTAISAASSSIAYAPSVTPNIDIANIFDVGMLTGSIAVNAPSGTYHNGQIVCFRFTQNGSGGNTITWNSIFAFGTDVTVSQIPITANAKFEIEFKFHSGDGKWRAVSIVRGF